MKALITALLMLAASQASGTDCANLAAPDAQLECYDRLARCAGTPDPDERLDCYRRASSVSIEPAPSDHRAASAASAREPSPAPEPPVTQAPPAVPAAPVSADRDSAPETARSREPAPRQAPAADPVPQSFDATVVDVSRDHRGRSYLTLDNGQIYRELSEGRFRFEAGMRVSISHGLFGSTNLHAEGMDKYVKVREVER